MLTNIDYEIFTDISNDLIAFVFRVMLSKNHIFLTSLCLHLAIPVTICKCNQRNNTEDSSQLHRWRQLIYLRRKINVIPVKAMMAYRRSKNVASLVLVRH